MSVMTAFERHMMPSTEIDKFNLGGRELLQDKFDRFIAQNKPIEMTLLGFPFKSTNTLHKTLGEDPDRAEEEALLHFQQMALDIKAEYEPGINLHIISDGYVFNHLMDIKDKTVQTYQEQLESFAGFKIINPWDFYDRNMSISTIREKIKNQFMKSDVELSAQIISDVEINELYKAFIKFQSEDLSWKSYDSNKQRYREAKARARQILLWNNAYSDLIRTQFTEPLGAVRLSMHPSTNYGTKYSINLINSESHKSPWHSCLVVHKDGSITTMHRKDAESIGGTLIYKDNKPHYYEA